jgi:E3 ubiquitin-protein ligase HUWE1
VIHVVPASSSDTFISERTSQSTLHTVQLVAFYRVGGLQAIFEVCRKFTDTITRIMQTTEDRTDIARKELVHAFGGLKVALHIVQPIISSKPLFESGQTLLVMTRDKKDTDPEYFEPHNFLVKLRLAALPLLRTLWEAPWLVSAPLGLSRSVVQTVLELTIGENEESKGDSDGANGSAATPVGIVRPTGPDEAGIRQLTDMGFPRSAAERALVRTHNNVNAATELLLAHPFPFTPDPEPIQQEPSADSETTEETDTSIPATDADIQSEPPPTSSTAVSDKVADVLKSPEEEKSPEVWRKTLNEAREPLKAGISRQALLLVDEHLPLIFDLHIAFVRPASIHQEQSVRDLVEDIKAFTPLSHGPREQSLANRCRLVALVLCEVPSSLTQELRSTLMESLMILLDSISSKTDGVTLVLPRWLATHLLVTEALFTLGDQPRTIILPKEGEPIIAEEVIAGPLYTQARSKVFDFCLHLLTIDKLPNDELLSVLRLLVVLTRDHQTACQFVKRHGVFLLFKRLKVSAVAGSQSYIAIILRHIVEDSIVLQQIMQQAVKRYFSQPRTRVVEVGSLVRNCSAMALREPEIFIQVSRSLCQLDLPFSTTPHVSLKSEAATVEHKASQQTEEGDNVDMQVDVPSSNSVVTGHSEFAAPKESLEYIVHFLLGELMVIWKSQEISDLTLEAGKMRETLTPSKPNSNRGTLPKADGEDQPAESNIQDRYRYSCFLMQCLTELLFSYDSCKTAFLSFSPKRRPQTPAKEAGNKHRTVALNFLLSELISFGTINPHPGPDAQNRIMTCNWAMSVIVALCVDASFNQELKEISPDLVSVRKFVLEAVSRSIKDLPPQEPLDARYGRLLALSDLCNRLLIVRFNATQRKQQDEIPTHIAKIMLEKHFVATLTNALAEVDLNYPNVRSLVASILRPLEHLYVILQM